MRILCLMALCLGLVQCGVKAKDMSSSGRTLKGESGALQGDDAKGKDGTDEVVECAGMLFYLNEDHGACDPAPETRDIVKGQEQPTPPDDGTTANDGKPTLDPAANGDPDVVVFHIKAGTGNGEWNTKDTIVSLKIGQTLRLVNDDAIAHRLHTGGAPCPHGSAFQAKATYDCLATKAFDATASAPLYDHNAGPNAEFWVRVER